jgi:hypothetical protein
LRLTGSAARDEQIKRVARNSVRQGRWLTRAGASDGASRENSFGALKIARSAFYEFEKVRVTSIGWSIKIV